jgi:hypothetical protein
LGASRPLATLSAGPDSIRLRIWFLDEFTFRPDQVAAITTYSLLPMLDLFPKGIRIEHCVMDYPESIVFYGGNDLLDRVREAGFIPQALASSIPVRPGMAFRWQAALVILVVYNVMGLLDLVHGFRDFFQGKVLFPLPGPFTPAALLLLLGTSIATLRWPTFQRMMVKPGRRVGEVRGFLRFTIIISVFLCVGFTFMFLLNRFVSPVKFGRRPLTDQLVKP